MSDHNNNKGYMMPFTRTVNLQDGTVLDAELITRRHIADLKGLFADPGAEQQLMAMNPLIYEVYEAAMNPDVAGQLRYSTTVIYPGKVGQEYFMTKGHYHHKADRSELYYGLQGEGCLLLQTPEGQISTLWMTPGTLAYVPPHWGHRTMNVGAARFVFLAVYPADAGYDYATIANQGFASIIVDCDGKPEVVANPRYKG